MKLRNLSNLSVAVVGLWALAAVPVRSQSVLGGQNARTVVFIKADGSCQVTNQTTQSRKALETQVAYWERSEKMANAEPDDNETPAPRPALKVESLSDTQLVAKIRDMYQKRGERLGSIGEPDKLDSVEVDTNSVRLVTSRAFGSLKELFSQNLWSWAPHALMFENARAEIDTNQQLRITFIPSKNAERYSRNFSRNWKSTNARAEWKLVLPGKILSSGFGFTDGNTTGFTLDGSKAESIEATLKLLGAPLTIIAEAGGLKVGEPLETKKLAVTRYQLARSTPDLPITEAGPGFVAEPIGIALSTIHYFAEGEKYFRQHPSYGFGTETGAVVSAKLFPPRGREIKSVSGVRVTQAKDDKGRSLAKAATTDDSEAEDYSQYTTYSSSDSEKGATRIDLHMGLPSPDAQSIEAIEAEAVAFTLAGWKELVLTNVQANATNEIDLAEVLPDTKMIIKKTGKRRPQISVEAVLTGPPTISQVEIKIKLNTDHGGSHMSDRRPASTSGGKTTRNLTIQGYQFDPTGEAKDGPITLLVRYPQDMKRERVKFKLTGVDLL